ncbi:22730_t:CDS:2, partial [Dentiscutata erythropus]
VPPKCRPPTPTVTEIFDAYYDLEESAEEPVESVASGSEEGKIDLEVLLQRLVTECEAITRKWAPEEVVQEPPQESGVEKDENVDSKEQFDPGGFDPSGIIVEKDLEKANEKWKKKVRVFLGENEGDFDENKREEFVPPRAPTFDAAPGQVVAWSMDKDEEQTKGSETYTPWEILIRKSWSTETKEKWNETRVYDPGGKQRMTFTGLTP